MWKLYGDELSEAENNEYRRLSVSGIDEEIKIVDRKLKLARDCIHSFLGIIFSYRCKISPAVLYQAISGLAALPIRSQSSLCLPP